MNTRKIIPQKPAAASSTDVHDRAMRIYGAKEGGRSHLDAANALAVATFAKRQMREENHRDEK